MSWGDLFIDMDMLFMLPALPVAGFLVWQAGQSAARLYRSDAASDRSASAGSVMSYGSPCGGASQFH